MSKLLILPETALVLEMLAASEGPHLGDVPADAAREVFGLMGAIFDAAPDPAIRTADFTGSGLALRAYFPGKAKAGPVIVFLHGGGWVIGNLETHDALCTLIAGVSGLRVVAVDYRLAPEHSFPAAHEDCLAAARFIASGPPELEAPVTGVAVAGDSAGGNLAFYVAAKMGKDKLLGQFLIYPVGDCTSPDSGSYAEFAEGYLLDRKMMDRFIADYLPDAAQRAHPDVSPSRHPLPSDIPPAVILTAGLDPLRDQGRDLAGQIAAQGAEVHLIEAQGLIHGMATMRKSFPTGERIIRRAVTIFAEMIAERMNSQKDAAA